MIKKLLIIIIIISAAVISSFFLISVNSDKKQVQLTPEEKGWLLQHAGTVVVAADTGFPPMDFVNEQGLHDGMAEDYFRLIEEKLNFRFKRANNVLWAETLKKTKNREIDVLKCAMKTPERSEYMLFSQPYLSIPSVIIVNTKDKRNLGLSDLTTERIGVTDGFSSHEYIKNKYKGLNIVPVKNDFEGLAMVSTGELDAMLSDLPTASYALKKNGIGSLRIAGQTEFVYELAIGTRSDWPILNGIFVKALNSITANERNFIHDKWITLEYRRFLYSSKFWYTWIVAISLIVFVVVMMRLWNRSLISQVQIRTRELNDYKNHLESKVEERTRDLQKANNELKAAMAQVKTLSGLLPICASCKKIRDDRGYWKQIESYIGEHSGVEFSHSMCPECAHKYYPEIFPGEETGKTGE